MKTENGDAVFVKMDIFKQALWYTYKNNSFKWFQFGMKKRGIKFVDTVNILPMGVKDMGDVIGVPKMDHPSCFGKIPKTINELD